MRRLALVAAALGLGLLACAEAEEEQVSPARPVTVDPVVAVDLTDHIEASGELIAVERGEIAAEVGGRVTAVLRSEGARVEAGEAVMAIDPERRELELESARARLDEARAALAEAERELRRIRELFDRNVASQTQLDEAETRVKRERSRALAARAERDVAERALEDAKVKAPFSGHVAERLVSRGEFVTPGQQLFELVSLDPIEVEFRVTEVESARVRLGQGLDVRLAPYPDERFRATVSFVAPTIDTRTRTLRVKARLENPEGRLRPGLFARVDLGVATRQGVPMVPEEAILQRVDGAVVFRLDGPGRVERRSVRTGIHRDGLVEVASGLDPGDQIVTRGHRDLVDGASVVPRHPDGTRVQPKPLANVGEGPGNTP